jgi:hypothetical protein
MPLEIKPSASVVVGWVDPSWRPWAPSINFGYPRKNTKKSGHPSLKQSVNSPPLIFNYSAIPFFFFLNKLSGDLSITFFLFCWRSLCTRYSLVWFKLRSRRIKTDSPHFYISSLLVPLVITFSIVFTFIFALHHLWLELCAPIDERRVTLSFPPSCPSYRDWCFITFFFFLSGSNRMTTGIGSLAPGLDGHALGLGIGR